MIKDIETKFIEGNLRFKWKIMQELESIEIEEDIPKYPVLILTCMDSRINIHKIFQLNLGDVFILRNAGNQYTQDMFRSILLTIVRHNIKDVIILGHLDCGMTKINLTELRMNLPSKFLSSLSRNYSDLLSKLKIYFRLFNDEIQNMKEQIKTLEKIKDFYPEIEITGMLYDSKTGLVFEYERFKDYRDIDDFKKKYKEILVEKKNQFTDFLGKFKAETVRIDDSKDISQKSELNGVEISLSSERKEENKDTSILENIVYNDDKIQTIIPKINIPKIRFHGVKIYIPKRFGEKTELKNNN